MKLASIFVFYSFLNLAIACTAPPSHLFESPYELVRSTRTIVLARAINETSETGGYFYDFTFKTLRVLKGDDPGSFKLTGFSVTAEGIETTDFDGHRAPEFWSRPTGFSSQPGDCNAYGIFEIGHDYLIFLRREPHVRAYEPVKSDDDFWLQVVEAAIEDQRQ